ncbi:MAG: AMIN domain-containing protein, partial [Cyanobacteria bacterium P01_H01_bin.58]
MMTKVLQGWNLLAIGTVLSGQALLIAAAQAELLTHNHGLVTEGTSLIDNEALIPDESVPDATLDGLLVHTLEPTTIHSEQATHRPSSLTAQTSEANRIVDIQLDETDSGVEIVLATEARTLSLPQTQVSGNALIVTIANAVLALPEGEEFLVFEPAEGIAVIQAVNLTEDTVQLSITGTAAPPIAEVTAEAQTLRLGVTLGVPAVAA